MGKEAIILCGLNERPSKVVSNVGNEDNSRWPMAFQHANDITQVEAPSSTTVQNMFHVKYFMV
jgi:hypothetical protein